MKTTLAKKLIGCLFCWILSLSFLWGQVNIDSLTTALSYHPDNPEKIELLNLLSKELVFTDPAQAIGYAKSALLLSNKYQDDHGRLMANKLLGTAKAQQGFFKSSINYFKASYTFAQKLKNLLQQGKILNNVGICYANIYDYQKAVLYLKKSLAIKETLKDKKGIANTLNNIGVNYSKVNDYENALFYYLKALRIRKTLDQPKSLASSYINLASVYFSSKKMEEALQHYDLAIQVLEPTKLSLKKVYAYHGKAETLITQKRYQEAETILQSALKIVQRLQHTAMTGKILNSLASIQLSLDNDQAGIDLLQQVLSLQDTIKAKAFALLNLGNVNFKLKNYTKAEQYYQDAQHWTEVFKLEDLSMKLAYRMAQFYEQRKQYKKSLAFFKDYKNYNDSLMHKNNLNHLSELQVRYETKEKATQIEHLKLKELQNQRNLSWAFISLLIISLCLIITVYSYKQSKKKDAQIRAQQIKIHQKEKAILEEEVSKSKEKHLTKSKELVSKTIHVLEQNQLIDKIKTQFLELKKYADQKTQAKFQTILNELDIYKTQDTWKEFEKYFIEVNQSFYHNLSQQYPKLSPKDLKLCAYLKLNMNSKEIATLLHISHKSVEVARARLRKKLAITNKSISLHHFLANF